MRAACLIAGSRFLLRRNLAFFAGTTFKDAPKMGCRIGTFILLQALTIGLKAKSRYESLSQRCHEILRVSRKIVYDKQLAAITFIANSSEALYDLLSSLLTQIKTK